MCIDLNFIKIQIGDPRILWLVLKDAHLCGPLPLLVSCASLFRGRNGKLSKNATKKFWGTYISPITGKIKKILN